MQIDVLDRSQQRPTPPLNGASRLKIGVERLSGPSLPAACPVRQRAHGALSCVERRQSRPARMHERSGCRQRDQALKELMLFEGRRIRKAGSGSDILITSGYLRFSAAVEEVITDMTLNTPLAEKISPPALTSALIGMFESMLRDQVLARRANFHFSSTPEEVRTIFDLFVSRLLSPASEKKPE